MEGIFREPGRHNRATRIRIKGWFVQRRRGNEEERVGSFKEEEGTKRSGLVRSKKKRERRRSGITVIFECLPDIQ
ncbi:hypothetical protein TcasGA2_TC014983 [Tribolium castaneum]|uniref:Uncharacterized protein n=1 Tax=Tribolium castaneum TaxID=7070 RepID=D2A6H7_TRICA|nr:hypothetical protein TcasGA2_TC014983 [Tribolium castaneum]